MPGVHRRRDVLMVAGIALASLLVCVGAYLFVALPGAWFPSASPKAWGVRDLVLARGTGGVSGSEIIVSAPDANGITLVTLTTELRSSDYAGIAWIATGLADNADIRMLWRSDYQPDKLNSAPLHVESGRLQPVVVAGNAAWVGRITGLALALHGPLLQPVRVRGVVAKPMGALETVGDRLREWTAFERWTGTSINTVTGGADNQGLPLPLLLISAGVLAALIVAGVHRRWRHAFGRTTPVLIAGLFVAAWFVLDARWTLNLAQQFASTSAQYGGKDLRDKHLASDDGPLFALIERVRAALPSSPVRIFVVADADYFRERAAYHLYPNSVYYVPLSNELPPAGVLHAGDWLLVYQRRGIQYDATLHRIRWGDQTVNADAKLVEPGAALFLIR